MIGYLDCLPAYCSRCYLLLCCAQDFFNGRNTHNYLVTARLSEGFLHAVLERQFLYGARGAFLEYKSPHPVIHLEEFMNARPALVAVLPQVSHPLPEESGF